jgi:hypothetical protein
MYSDKLIFVVLGCKVVQNFSVKNLSENFWAETDDYNIDPWPQVIGKYLDHAIELDYTYVVVKYNVQQILGSDQVLLQRYMRDHIQGDQLGRFVAYCVIFTLFNCVKNTEAAYIFALLFSPVKAMHHF